MPATRDSDGFRLRGLQPSRLETFVDAAFAFAVTLLVISFDAMPTSVSELQEALKRAPAFLACFAILAMFWSTHHRFSRRTGLMDARIAVLGLSLVAVTLLYVYPLRLIMGVALHFLTGGWAPSPMPLDDLAGGARSLYVIYGVGFAAMCLLLVLLNRYGLARAHALALDPLERCVLQQEVGAMTWLMLTAFASVLLALLPLPAGSVWQGLPGMVYCALAVLMPWFGLRSARRLARVRAGMAAGEA
ncbi:MULTISPECIES: TMEM175 family protein [Luteimonas]|uniref:TMEM175 family protein n=1 Tax=Luteimonas TaxID=83614 RepID=UPI0013046F07|nr:MULTISPECIES: TMEM175 family protein [Luteimonas]